MFSHSDWPPAASKYQDLVPMGNSDVFLVQARRPLVKESLNISGHLPLAGVICLY